MGRLLAIKLASKGAKIIIWDINKRGLEETAQEITKAGGKAFHQVVDISKREEIYKAAAQAKKQVGDVTILINNAGIVTGKKFTEST